MTALVIAVALIFLILLLSGKNKSNEELNIEGTAMEEVKGLASSNELELEGDLPEVDLNYLNKEKVEVEEKPALSDSKNKKKMTVEEKLQVQEPELNIDPDKSYVAKVHTNMGDIKILLNAKDKPITVNNFVELSKMGFYDDTIFHRVIDGFMIQGGDPLGSGYGGPNYKFVDELKTANKNAKGTISMANSGSNTNGSQFFINQVDNFPLDTKHTVFGSVVEGMDVVEKIAKVETDEKDKPITSVVIESIEIVEL